MNELGETAGHERNADGGIDCGELARFRSR
jgi:hypothetical protein